MDRETMDIALEESFRFVVDRPSVDEVVVVAVVDGEAITFQRRLTTTPTLQRSMRLQ